MRLIKRVYEGETVDQAPITYKVMRHTLALYFNLHRRGWTHSLRLYLRLRPFLIKPAFARWPRVNEMTEAERFLLESLVQLHEALLEPEGLRLALERLRQAACNAGVSAEALARLCMPDDGKPEMDYSTVDGMTVEEIIEKWKGKGLE